MLILQRPWDSQPQDVVGVDRSNPLAATFTHFLPLNGDPREVITNARLTYGTGGTIVPSTRGIVLQGTGVTARASVPINLSAFRFLSISFWLYWDAFANDDKLAFEFTVNGAGANAGFAFDPNASNGRSQFFTSNGTAFAKSFTRPSALSWHHYALTVDTGTPGALIAAYVDGVAQTLTQDSAGGAGFNFANSTLYLLSRAGTSLFGAGKLQNLTIRGGYLMGETEARREYENPWQIFEPRHVYIPTSITSGAYTLNLETGSYSFTGLDAVLLRNSQLTLDSGSYSLTGSNASLLKGLILEASSGTYTLSGSNASLLYTHLLSASSGTYTINGADATLTYTPASGTYTLNAESGTYLLAGSDVTFIYSGSEVTIKAGSWIRYRIIT